MLKFCRVKFQLLEKIKVLNIKRRRGKFSRTLGVFQDFRRMCWDGLSTFVTVELLVSLWIYALAVHSIRYELYEIRMGMNFSCRSISAARCLWGQPHWAFNIIIRCLTNSIRWTYHKFIIKFFNTYSNEHGPWVDIGMLLGLRTTMTEAIMWWTSARLEVTLEANTGAKDSKRSHSIRQITWPWIRHAQQFTMWLNF